jgi:cyclase
MVAKRIVPCLDIKGGRTVKGVNFFDNVRDVGDPVELAARYCCEGADELVFLDISATDEERGTTLQVVRQVANTLDIPFTVGGGVRSVADVSRLLEAGADKVSINSAAVRTPDLIDTLAREFGSQCIAIAIDSRCTAGSDEVFILAGKAPTGRRTFDWAQEVYRRGAGEILLTSMDNDGVQKGFALEITKAVGESVPIPVIASGGAGEIAHFMTVLRDAGADAALAASVFHDRVIAIPELKRFLAENGVEVRM